MIKVCSRYQTSDDQAKKLLCDICARLIDTDQIRQIMMNYEYVYICNDCLMDIICSYCEKSFCEQDDNQLFSITSYAADDTETEYVCTGCHDGIAKCRFCQNCGASGLRFNTYVCEKNGIIEKCGNCLNTEIIKY